MIGRVGAAYRRGGLRGLARAAWWRLTAVPARLRLSLELAFAPPPERFRSRPRRAADERASSPRVLYVDTLSLPTAQGNVQGIAKAYRAILRSGEKSLSFSMSVPHDRVYNPFGRASLQTDGQPC